MPPCCPCHNICLYEDLFLIKWQHQIESNRCCRHSASSSVPASSSSSSPALRCDCAISESASAHPLLPLPASSCPPVSQSHPRLVTSLHDLKLRRRRRFDVRIPRMRMWTCHGIHDDYDGACRCSRSSEQGASLLTRMRSVSHSIRQH